ncbi:HD domain-containing protein [Cerasicoccus frondis]|uniref:HD domain-containing protein n=1 Tax=Cerasicoccus frondis TaxID=490090 RepID=UPI00285249ED|nr:HD domain-containing protein [Cerasicoccus frondis]
MIEAIIPFIVESEKLKSVQRRTKAVAHDRRENSAEHSWSLALAAITLFPASNEPLDQVRTLKMLLIHDLVEIDAGDTYCYDIRPDKAESEHRAAERIFGLLPADLTSEFMELWLEFEACDSPEAKFANALDRLLPLIQNYQNNGQTWLEHGIVYEQVYARNESIRDASEELWAYVKKLLDDASARGLLPKRSAE